MEAPKNTEPEQETKALEPLTLQKPKKVLTEKQRETVLKNLAAGREKRAAAKNQRLELQETKKEGASLQNELTAKALKELQDRNDELRRQIEANKQDKENMPPIPARITKRVCRLPKRPKPEDSSSEESVASPPRTARRPRSFFEEVGHPVFY